MHGNKNSTFVTLYTFFKDFLQQRHAYMPLTSLGNNVSGTKLLSIAAKH